MTDETKLGKIPDFYTTNWFTNSNFSLSNPFERTDFNCFEGYIKPELPNFDSFMNQSYLPTNYNFNSFSTNFNINFPNYFDFSSLTSFMPKIEFNFANIFGLAKPSSQTISEKPAEISVPPSTKPVEPVEDVIAPTPSATVGKAKKAVGNKGKLANLPVYDVTINGTKIHKFNSTNISNLKPDLQDSLVKLTKLAESHGYYLVISDGYRSISAQADVKRRKPKLAASPGKSAHNYGCAIDIAVYSANSGEQVCITQLPWFYNYAKGTLGLAWGQDWKHHIKESWHFERKDWNKPGSDVYLAYCRTNGITPRTSVA